MPSARLAREVLWDAAAVQHGFITARQARDLGVSEMAVQMLYQRGTLERRARGVYRFPLFPASQYDPHMLAVLWTGADEACLSHESALDAYAISDINPDAIDVTVRGNRRLRKARVDRYIVHYEDLEPAQIGWWQEVPIVTATTAVTQCIAYGTPTYLIRQALERGRRLGYLTAAQHDQLAQALEERVTRTQPAAHQST
jgi:predicted transcriptional regulator of viral defense system